MTKNVKSPVFSVLKKQNGDWINNYRISDWKHYH